MASTPCTAPSGAGHPGARVTVRYARRELQRGAADAASPADQLRRMYRSDSHQLPKFVCGEREARGEHVRLHVSNQRGDEELGAVHPSLLAYRA